MRDVTMRLVLFALACLLARFTGAQTAERYPARWDTGTTPSPGFKSLVELADGTLLTVSTRQTGVGSEQVCYRSPDAGNSWTPAGIVCADPDRRTDLGDAMIMQRRDGEILCSYRHNHHSTTDTALHSYAIRVAASRDGGRTWTPHSTVAECTATAFGLWSSFLLERSDGSLQCTYDDEDAPSRNGMPRHQWLTMKTWNAAAGTWENPVTVSRAHDPAHLSRDGMPCVMELPGGRLLCVFESVRTGKPWKGCIRSVTSDDGGRTWSWRDAERPYVYAPRNEEYNALCPWTIRLQGGALLCAFVTDEDRPGPDTPATAILDESVKVVYSHDDGRTWSAVPQTVSVFHPEYAPGVVQLRNQTGAGELVMQFCAPKGNAVLRGRTDAVDTTTTRARR